MQTWKRKKPYHRPAQAGTTTGRRARVAAAGFLLATVVAGLASFPQPWNAAASAIQEKTGVAVPTIPEPSFRLGLDLQGGTHLVYGVDMSDIPAADRDDVLAGVRDIIERRVNAFGVAEPLVQTTSTGGQYRLIVELAGVLDVTEAVAQIGETPVLEFREPNTELDREPTEEERALLDEIQSTQRADAEDALARAQRAPNDFAALVEELSVDLAAAETLGKVGNLAADDPLIQAVTETRSWAGRVVPRVVETAEGLNVVKYLGQADGEEMLLSHILICHEGSFGCTNPIPEIEASILANRLKEEATPENFAALAMEYSSDPGSGFAGGDLDWIAPGQTILPFELAARQLAVGAISEPVVTEFGYHLIYKRDRRTVRAHQVERILLPLTQIEDIVPPESPWKNTALSGKHLQRATVQFDPTVGFPYVALQFNAEGGDLFAELTGRMVGQPIAIFLDGQPISTPIVQQVIHGGQAVINGDFTLDEAKVLVQRLNAGALPVPITLLSQQTVGPTLGLASLTLSVKAAALGFLLVAIFMSIVYRLPGVLAVLALALYAGLNLLAYRFFGVTVTLAGIAGFILSVGIATDANVLVFERVKDEARAGRDLTSALEEGFRRAWPPIRDGHLTTLIAAAVLYSFSSSFVRGFALTLAIGVLLSFFTALTVTRSYLRTAARTKALRHPWLYGIKNV